RRRNGFRQYPPERFPDRNRFDFRHGGKAGADGLARLVDPQRVRIVVIEAADRLGDRAHSLCSSSRVLMLRNASASSSNCTSTNRSEPYQASILRPPFTRNASRFFSRSV